MRNPSSIKQEFFKKWIVGLRKCRFLRRNSMNSVERKKAIKLSADIAMASAKKQTTRWSRAIIANASKEDNNRLIMKQMLGSASPPPSLLDGEFLNNRSFISQKRERRAKMVKRSRCGSRIKRSRSKKMMATSVAKRVVQKRTKVLKSLVPGGEFMDDFSLIEETLDYITHLKAQVDVMRCLASNTELLNHNRMNCSDDN